LVQATLLSFGIAVILALVAAMVGPVFIDWTQYRGAIEAEASRIVGAPVRIAGPIDVRLLPTPSLNLKGIEIGPAGAPRALAARGITMEFGLSTLLRGEFRADEANLDGPEFTIGLDQSGALELPAANLGFDPDRLAIDRLAVEHGHITFTDAASGTRFTVDDVRLAGELRSLSGPYKADGSFAANGEHFNFRISTSRRADDGAMKLRLAVDAMEPALAFDSDGTLWIAQGVPRYEGAATLSRVVGTALPGRHVAINDPWKVTGKVKANAGSAAFSELDLQYGPDVRSFHVAGSAVMNFGRSPGLAADLGVRQLDLDRVLGESEQKRLPFAIVRTMAESLVATAPPPIPLRIGIGFDSVTAGGIMLTGVRGDIRHTADGWNLDSFDLRAPGATMLHLAGKFIAGQPGTAEGVAFAGPLKIDSGDPAVFLAWVEGRSPADRAALGPMHAGGTVTLAGDRAAVEGLAAEIDRKPLEGRLAYRFATAAKPARLDATLRAADLDFDRGIAIGNAMFASSTAFDRPGEIALSLDIGHAIYAGIEARQAHAMLTYDAAGLKIERLSVADIGGTSVEANGRVDGIGEAARGSIAVTLAAPRLDGATALADRFMPGASEILRKYGSRMLPFRVNGKLEVEPRPANAAGARTAAKLKLDGRLAGIDIDLDGSATGDITDPAAAAVRFDGRLNAPEARRLAALLGLDILVNADARPARATFTIDGAVDRGFKMDGKFAGTDVNASAAGNLAAAGNGTFDVSLRAADSRLPRRGGAVPVDLKSRMAIDNGTVKLSDLAGKIAGTNVKGDLSLGIGEPLKIDGHIAADQVDAAELTALFTGTPRGAPARPGQVQEWPAEPFGLVAMPALEGQIELRATAARWLAFTARQLSGTLRFTPSALSLSDMSGTLADGRLGLDANFRRDGKAVVLASHVKLTNADLPALLAGALRVPASGRISLDAELQGQGLSAASLIGALEGTGTVTVERADIAGLDPNAVNAVIAALERDRALASNAGRVNDAANAGLDGGRLKLSYATAPLVIADGRAQLLDLAVAVQNTDITGLVSLGLNDGLLDARLAMTGPQRPDAPAAQRPQMTVSIRGPLTAARRRADVANLVSWVTIERVEQESKRLEEAEKEHQRLEAQASSAASSTTSSTTSSTAPPATSSASSPPGRSSDGAAPAPSEARPPAARRGAPPAPKPFSLMDLIPGR
jgi:hypothetical protein